MRKESFSTGSGRAGPEGPVRVIYVTGYGRSGSTLLDIALGNEAGVTGLGELTALSRHAWDGGEYCACGAEVSGCAFWKGAVARFEEQSRRGNVSSRFAALRKLQRIVEALPALARVPRPGLARYRDECVLLLRAIRSEIAAGSTAAGKEADELFLLDSSKLPGRGLALAGAPGIELFVVHLTRDPRGVVWSMSKGHARRVEAGIQRELKPRSAVYVALRWLLVNRGAERLCRMVGAKRAIHVRYEDFVADPQGTTAAIMARCRGAAALPTARMASAAIAPVHQVAGSRHRMESSLVIRADEGWKREMPVARRRLVAAITGPLLRRYGYPEEDGAPGEAGVPARA